MRFVVLRKYLYLANAILVFQLLLCSCCLVVLNSEIRVSHFIVMCGVMLLVALNVAVIVLWVIIYKHGRCPCCGKLLLTNYKSIRRFENGNRIECPKCKFVIEPSC